MKIGLYGGTFDPIHIGHLIVLENTLNFMGLDKIIVLPSSNPPHKQNKKKTDTSIRVEMVKAAIEDNPKLELSTFEANDDSVIYTHQTLDYFKNKYPEHEFYYIMGEDSFMTIDSWRNYEKILNDHLIVFARTSIEKDSDLVKKFEQIKKDNEKIYLIDNLNINISSTLIREEDKVKTAAILHDCAKYNEDKYMMLYGENIDSYQLQFKAVLHSFLGAEVAKKEYNINDNDVLDAIKYHTTGRENMTQLDKIIYLADAIEEKRNYPGVDHIRKLAKNDLDEAILYSLDHNITYIIEKNDLIHPLTIDARNYLIKEKNE